MLALVSNNDLIGEIYEASSNPSHWQAVLGMVAEKIDADSATLLYRDFDNPESDISFVHTNQSQQECDQMVKEYETYYHRLDPMWNLAADHAKIGVAIADSQLGISREDYEKLCPTDYLENYMRKYDRWYVAGSYIFQDEDKALVIAVQRGINSSPWTAKEMDYLTSLTPHFQRAFRIHREFIELRTSLKHLKTCIDRLLMGLIIIKPNGEIAFINDLAKTILAENPALVNNNNTLQATPAYNDNQLQSLIQRTRHYRYDIESDDDPIEAVTAIALKADESSAPLPILVTSIVNNSDIDKNDNKPQPPNYVALFFADPERAQQHSRDVISEFYGLTRAEAGVAIAISNGHTVAEYAHKNSVAESTVRTQVKQIFQKLNVSRQAEIVKVLLQTPNITPPN